MSKPESFPSAFERASLAGLHEAGRRGLHSGPITTCIPHTPEITSPEVAALDRIIAKEMAAHEARTRPF